MHEPGLEIIRPVFVSNHPCHFEAVKVLPAIAVEEAATERIS
jgi:hypothetical protein